MTTPMPHRISDSRRLPARQTPSGAEPEHEDRQHPPQRVEQAHARLRLLQALGVEELEPQPIGSIGRLSKIPMPRSSSSLRSRSTSGREVEDDLAVFGLDDLAAAGERLLDLLVRGGSPRPTASGSVPIARKSQHRVAG